MKAIDYFFCFLFVVSIIGVLATSRTEFYTLFAWYTLAFASYAKLVLNNNVIPFQLALLLAIVCRVISFFFSPQLSDDYFRFIWDGMVMFQGVHPMAFTPAYLVNHPEIAQTNISLFASLNSPNYFAVYPPVAQLICYVSFYINQFNIEGHIVFYRIIAFIADGLIIWLLWKLLPFLQKPIHRIWLYGLNPLIIIEFTGNLHMESVMIAFLLAALNCYYKKQTLLSGILMALSIATKMLTLILVPFFPREMNRSQTLIWASVVSLITMTIFWLSFQHHSGWMESIGLWFLSFEFNASIYYLVREIDSAWRGYNNIRFIGPALGLIAIAGMGITWMKYWRNPQFHLIAAMVIVLTMYHLFSTTVHPWYLGTILALSVLSGHTFPIVWTYLIFLSYSHYADGGFEEKYLFIWAEYVLLFMWMFPEIIKRTRRNTLQESWKEGTNKA